MKPPVENTTSVQPISFAQRSVLRTLLYFNIFDHPLTESEIFHLTQDHDIRENDIKIAINELTISGLIRYHDGYFFLNNKKECVARRRNGEVHAAQAMQKAARFSKLISKFPFVRAVALSGSLSKNYMDSKTDIDYFVITAPERMWVARTLLVLYKKVFLLNSHKYFCVNYFLSEDNLEVPDKNIFTATEVSFLIPTCNYKLYHRFKEANNWSMNFLPNFPLRSIDNIIPDKKYLLKNFLEKMLSGTIGEKLDGIFFRQTIRFWKKKFKHFDDSTFDLRLRSRKNVSKHHPLGYQEKILNGYSESMTAFATANNISFHAEDTVYA